MTFFAKKNFAFHSALYKNKKISRVSEEDLKYRLLAHQQSDQSQKFFEMHAETQAIIAQRAEKSNQRFVEIEKKLFEVSKKQSATEKELDSLSFAFAITCLTCTTLFVANVLKAIEK